MSKILKPRRGSTTVMQGSKKTTVLAAGEIFFETPASGPGSDVGVGIKMGDGTTQYSNLPYFMKGVTSGNVTDTEITITTDSSTTAATAISNVSSGKKLGVLLGSLKQAISLTKTELGNSIDGLSTTVGYLGSTNSSVLQFPIIISGSSYGYKNSSNQFVAFRGDSTDTYTYASGSTGGTVDLGARNNYRYVNATNVYNKGKSDGVTTHTGTYTFPSNDTGGTKDLGTIHNYRYVNATNVYNAGKAAVNTKYSNAYMLYPYNTSGVTGKITITGNIGKRYLISALTAPSYTFYIQLNGNNLTPDASIDCSYNNGHSNYILAPSVVYTAVTYTGKITASSSEFYHYNTTGQYAILWIE